MEGEEGYLLLPLFETKRGKGRIMYRLFALTIFLGLCFIWAYRFIHLPKYNNNHHKLKRWFWIGLFMCELWFGLYWIISQSLRWNIVYRSTFKDRLSHRFEKELPGVDIFVCTADPKIEPPMLVINTVLSVMAYDYSPEKLTVYLSDDGGSDLTYYALLEASCFAKHWIPFCKNFNVEPRSPASFFNSSHHHQQQQQPFNLVKKLYEEMKTRINTAVEHGRVSDDIRSKHRGFSQWKSSFTQRDHDTILQIVIDGRRDPNAKDIEGGVLPSLVYLAREKRPRHFHNFKAGAMNALIRVSSQISNGEIILNVDCDMYSNNSASIRDALCFFMDERNGHDIAFVQFPQNFNNITENDLYGSCLRAISEVEFHGLDGYGGPLYIGTGCFHRRDTICGRKYIKGHKFQWNSTCYTNTSCTRELEEIAKGLASSSYEENTQWGKQMGLKYGVPVEDVITGLSIQSEGWKSVYFNPAERKGFLGLAPTTLGQSLLQHKRWSEGDFQIMFSNYSPAWYGLGKISFGHILGYCNYCLWSPNCLATVYYSIIPSLSLLKDISLFPKVSSLWFVPFGYVIFASYTYSLVEFVWLGGTVKGWWNEQRMWLYKRTTSYLFAFIDTVLKQLGFTKSAFVITAKVADDDVSQRYEQEIMEFGTSSSSMFTMLSIIAMLNLFCCIVAVVNFEMGLQIVLCGVLVLINLPLYQGLFLRKDNGRIPTSLTIKSFAVAMFISSTCFALL